MYANMDVQASQKVEDKVDVSQITKEGDEEGITTRETGNKGEMHQRWFVFGATRLVIMLITGTLVAGITRRNCRRRGEEGGHSD